MGMTVGLHQLLLSHRKVSGGTLADGGASGHGSPIPSVPKSLGGLSQNWLLVIAGYPLIAA